MEHREKGQTHWRLTAGFALLIAVLLTVLLGLAACDYVTYEVAFYADGELFKTVDVLAGEKVSLPAALDTAQYGEVKDADGNPFDFDTPINEPMRLYAESKLCTVEFITADGLKTSVTVKWGGKVTEPLTEGYAWAKDGEIFSFDTPITGDLVLRQQAVAHTVSFVYEEGKTETVTVLHGAAAAAASLPDGYEAWTLDGAAYDFSKPVTSDLTLHSALKVLKVTFAAEEGATATAEVKYGHTVGYAELAEHHTAWTLDGVKYDFATPVTKDLKLESALELLDVTFVTEAGESKTVAVRYGHAAAAETVAENHTAWTLDGAEYDFSKPVTRALTLTSPLKLLKVTFTTEGAQLPTVKYVKYGEAVAPVLPEAHHTVWTLNGTAYDFSAKVTADLELVSEYEYLTVEYYDGDSVLAQVSVKYGSLWGSTVTLRNLPLHASAWKDLRTGEIVRADDLDGTLLTEGLVLCASYTDVSVKLVIGGVGEQTLTFKKGDKLPLQAVPANHTEWMTPDGKAYNFDTVLTGELTLVSKEIFTITFCRETLTGTEIQTVRVISGELLTALDLPEGYLGWMVGGALYDFSQPVTSSATLVASLKTVTIVFAAEDLTPEVYVVKYGSTVHFPALAEGYLGWSMEGEFLTATEDRTVTAKLQTFEVTYETEDGETVTETVRYGHRAENKALAAHHDAWTLNGIAYDFGTPVTGNLTLKSAVSYYTVTYVTEDGTTETVKLRSGSTAEAKDVAAYHTAWTLNGVSYDFNTPVTGDITLYSALLTKQVIYVTEDGEIVSVSVPYGHKTEALAPADHHTAWTLNGEVYDFGTPVTEDITLFAPLELLTVSFYDGEKLLDTIEVKYGHTVAAPALPQFATQWIIRGTEAAYDFSAPVTGNMQISTEYGMYTITLIEKDGETKTYRVKSGELLPEAAVPEHHDVWRLDSGKAYSFDEPVTGSFTLTSDWIWYTVTYTFNNKLQDQLTAKYHWGQKVMKPAEIPDQDAWMLDDEAFDFENTQVTGNLNLTALYRWVDVTFYTVDHDGKLTVVETKKLRMYNTVDKYPVASYYRAWTATKSGSGEAYDFDAPVAGDLALYAYVKKSTVTVKWYGGLEERRDDTLTYWHDETLADLLLFRMFEKVSYSMDGEMLTGSETPEADAFELYVKPQTFTIKILNQEGMKLVNTVPFTVVYDATTLANVILPDAIMKDAILKGYRLKGADGAAISTGIISGWWDVTTAKQNDASFTNLEIWVDFKAVNRAVTSEETGLTVSAAGELSIGNAAQFEAWMESTEGALVIPKTVDGTNVLTVKVGAFANKTSIKSLYIFDFAAESNLIGDTVNAVGAAGTRTFYSCTKLTDVVIWSDTVTSLGIATFCRTNTGLTRAVVVLGAAQKTAGTNWFNTCTTLKTAYVELSAASTAATLDNLFYGASNLESATLKFAGAKLGTNLFNGCKKLLVAELNAPALTVLPQSMFNNCELLESLNMNTPELTEIGSSAFSGCKAYTPGNGFENVTTIGSSAFNGCKSLTSLKFLTLKNVKFTTNSSSAFASTGLIEVVWDVAQGSVLPSAIFQNCQSLTSFVIPEESKANTDDLSSSVFMGCEKLTTVVIDFSRYEKFGNYGSLFQGTGLEKVDMVLNDSVTSLPGSLFSGCKNLVSVKITGKALANAGYSMFTNCTALESVVITNSGEVGTFMIPSGIFSGDTKLKTIDLPLPKSGAYSGQPTFTGLDSLEYVSNMEAYTDLLIANDNGYGKWYAVGYNNTPSGTFSIKAPLFAINPDTGLSMWNGEILIAVSHNDADTVGKTSVTIPATVKYIYSGAFGVDGIHATASVEKIEFSDGDNLKAIGQYAFEKNNAIQAVVLPNSVERIGAHTFENATALQFVQLPSNPKFTAIPDYAFEGTGKALTTVEIPAWVTSIGYSAFGGSWIETLTYESGSGEQITSVGSNVFANTHGNVDVYGILKGWEKLTAVPDYFLYGAYGTRGVNNVITVPAHYTKLGSRAFALMDNYPADYVVEELRETKVPDLTLVLESAESGSRTLTAGSNVFDTANASSTNPFKKVLLPSDATAIGGLFASAKGLTEIVIPAGVKVLDGTFSNCDTLTTVTFAEGSQLTTIKSNTFNNCKNLTAIVGMPSSVTSVGSGAFNGVKNAKMEVTWTLDQVDGNAFKDMYWLSGTITLTDAAMKTGIGSYAFAFSAIPSTLDGKNGNPNYQELPTLKINFTSAALTATARINSSAFANRNIVFAVDGEETTKLALASVATLGSYAFSYNDHLTEVSILFHTTSNSITLGTGAFQNCNQLASVRIGLTAGSKATAYVSISQNAFAYLPKLAYIEVLANTSYNKNTAFTNSFTMVETVTIKIIARGTATTLRNGTSTFSSAIAAATPWAKAAAAANVETVNIIIDETVQSIGDYAFYITDGSQQAKLCFYVAAAEEPTAGSFNNGWKSTSKAHKYVGLNTTWEYSENGVPTPKTDD